MLVIFISTGPRVKIFDRIEGYTDLEWSASNSITRETNPLILSEYLRLTKSAHRRKQDFLILAKRSRKWNLSTTNAPVNY